jgi:hypothetical protein
MSKTSLTIILLEDDHHKMLIYRHLRNCGAGHHQIRIELSPAGEGSAENWVRKRFVKETRAYRSRWARTALIVMIDADSYDVMDRLAQLDQALRENGDPTVGKDERIARLIPKRNVETWILCMNGQAVDEETDYKRTRNDWNSLIPKAARTLHQWTHLESEPPSRCVDSLRSSIGELRRLEL